MSLMPKRGGEGSQLWPKRSLLILMMLDRRECTRVWEEVGIEWTDTANWGCWRFWVLRGSIIREWFFDYVQKYRRWDVFEGRTGGKLQFSEKIYFFVVKDTNVTWNLKEVLCREWKWWGVIGIGLYLIARNWWTAVLRVSLIWSGKSRKSNLP